MSRLVDDLKRLAEMRDSGDITQNMYENVEADLLAEMADSETEAADEDPDDDPSMRDSGDITQSVYENVEADLLAEMADSETEASDEDPDEDPSQKSASGELVPMEVIDRLEQAWGSTREAFARAERAERVAEFEKELRIEAEQDLSRLKALLAAENELAGKVARLENQRRVQLEQERDRLRALLDEQPLLSRWKELRDRHAWSWRSIMTKGADLSPGQGFLFVLGIIVVGIIIGALVLGDGGEETETGASGALLEITVFDWTQSEPDTLIVAGDDSWTPNLKFGGEGHKFGSYPIGQLNTFTIYPDGPDGKAIQVNFVMIEEMVPNPGAAKNLTNVEIYDNEVIVSGKAIPDFVRRYDR